MDINKIKNLLKPLFRDALEIDVTFGLARVDLLQCKYCKNSEQYHIGYNYEDFKHDPNCPIIQIKNELDVGSKDI